MVRVLKPGLVAVVAAIAMVTAASAQFNSFDIPATDPGAFKIVTPAALDTSFRRIRAHFRELAHAKTAKDREPIVEAMLRACQAELNKPDNAVGVIAEDEDLWLGAYAAVERQILAIGDDSLPLYEKNFGGRAASLLEQARRESSREAMLEINRRFGLTRAGVRAAVLLAGLWWEEGEISLAARALERALGVTRLLEIPARANLAAWLGACYQHLGERANLSQLAKATRAISEREVITGDGARKLGELLQSQLQQTRDSTNDTIESLGVSWIGGNYANTGIPARPGDFDRVAWSRTLPRLESDQTSGSFLRYHAPIVPPFLPASDGMLFYVNIGDALVAYDVFTGGKSSGEPVWRVKPFVKDAERHRRLVGRAYDGESATDPCMILPVSVYKGVVFAALENPLNTNYHAFSPETTFRLYSHYPQVRRALCAVDGETGRLLWRVGGLYEGGEHEMTNFLSAVVHQGTLYALGTRVPGQAEIFLYALDPDTGEILWHLRLCYGQQETTMFGRPSRQPYPSLAAIAGGELYVCTNIGGVVAVNLARRCLSWIGRYSYMSRPVTRYIDTYYRPVTWYNSPTMYAEAEGRAFVVCAPTDSQNLVAFDAITGKQEWQISREARPGGRGDILHGGLSLVGIRNGIVYVAARHRLYLVNLADGKLLGGADTPPVAGPGRSAELAGRPCMAGSRLLWPTSGMLNEVDLDTRKFVGSYSAPSRVSGLSVMVQNGLAFTVSGNDYAAGNCVVAARFDAQRLMTDARLKVAESPGDAEAALRYGLLNLRLGERAEGIKYLERAHQLSQQPPINSRVRNASGRTLVSVQLDAADASMRQGQYLDALVSIGGARGYAGTPSELSECFVREETCLTRMNESDALRELYREAYEKDLPFGVGSNPQIPVRVYATLMLARGDAQSGLLAESIGHYHELLLAHESLAYQGVRLRQIAIVEVEALIGRAGAEAYAPHEKAARELVDKGDPDSLRRVLRLFPVAQCADEAVLRLARWHCEQGEPKFAVQLLNTTLEERPKRKRRAELLAQLALAYAQASEPAWARLISQRALREFPEAEIEIKGARQALRAVLAPLLRDDTELGTPIRLPEKLEPLWSRPLGNNIMYLPVQPVPGPQPELYIGINDRNRGDHLECLDPQDGGEHWSSPGAIAPQQCYRTRYGVLAVMARNLTLYAADGSPQWSEPTEGTPFTVDVANGLVAFTNRMFDPNTQKDLVRVTVRDLSNGGLIWRTHVAGRHPYWLKQVDDGVALLQVERQYELLLLNPETGAVQARQPLGNEIRAISGTLPFVRNGLIHVVDVNGNIYRFGAGLEMRPVLRCGETMPTMFIPHGAADILVAGQRSASLFDPVEGETRWSYSLKTSEAISERAVAAETLMLAVRRSDGTNRIVGVRLGNGAEAFSHEVKPGREGESVGFKSAAAHVNGMAFLYLLQDTSARPVRVSGQRVLVLDTAGAVTFDWTHRVASPENASRFMQLAVIDGYLVVNCDSELFCFGEKRE